MRNDNCIPARERGLILVHVTTVPDSLIFFRGQVRYLKEKGVQVHVVSSPGALLTETGTKENIPVHSIAMAREINLQKDLRALAQLFFLFKFLKPDIVHAHFPKGGLLGVIAARMARVPIVIYGMRGLRFDTANGIARKILYYAEALSCRLADQVICNSFAIWNRAIAFRLCGKDKIRVLGAGSSNGVDAEDRFNPLKLPSNLRGEMRQRYEIPADSLVLGFVGRIVRDKGIVELTEAWSILSKKFPSLYLMLIGPIESHDPVRAGVLDRLGSDPRVIFVGPVKDVAPYYGAIDLLALPTYREGFPNTPLEAAAMQLPVVATRVDGCTEAVADGATGLLVPPGQGILLAEAIESLLMDPEKRKEMGKRGRERVLRKFRPEIIWQALYENYVELLSRHPEINLPQFKSSESQ
jgi:glycosyltransferase involved in cell wall biosynthesis